MKDNTQNQGISRKSLLINAGKCAVGAAGISAVAAAVPRFASVPEATGGLPAK